MSPEGAAAGVLDAATEVVLALPDCYGRLRGVRLSGGFYRDRVVRQGYGACSYLLSTDMAMNAIPDYPGGFGDILLRPDPATARPLPWQDGAVLVIADALTREHEPVAVAPRHLLRHQLAALAARGLSMRVGTELEFLVFAEDYRAAAAAGYAGLRPAGRSNGDYALTGLGELDGLVRAITTQMGAAGLRVESARGECHRGQYEIVFGHRDALASCDDHVFYKTGARQLAEAAGQALTFMAKYDNGEGNSCHVHASLWDGSGAPALTDPSLLGHFVAGQLACLADFALLFAPTVNAYKRLQPATFAPTAVGWGYDDRTRALRVVGDGAGRRVEHRVGGGDANPYLVVAAIAAAGHYGIEHQLRAPEPGESGEPLPRSLAEAERRWSASPLARAAFGDTVVDHYARLARAELAGFDTAVTDWERHRYFEGP